MASGILKGCIISRNLFNVLLFALSCVLNAVRKLKVQLKIDKKPDEMKMARVKVTEKYPVKSI